MTTYSKSLLIFTLFAVFCLELKAHHCPYEKTHNKFEKGKTSTTTPAPTPAKPIKVNPKCNTGTVPSCNCGISTKGIDDNYYYPVPKSGNCADVFNKHLSKTSSDYHFREENCHKVQRTVCRIDSYCEDNYIVDGEQLGTTPPTPDEFLIGQNTSKPFCKCGYNGDHYPMPKSRNCTDLDAAYDGTGFSCSKAITLCRDTCYCNNQYVDPTKCDPQTCNNATKHFCMCGIDTCYCNNQYVDPTKCDPQTCNNATKPFCMCGIDGSGNYYPMPKSGDCTDVYKYFNTTLTYYYAFGFIARKVCKCTTLSVTHCECKDEWVSGCEF